MELTDKIAFPSVVLCDGWNQNTFSVELGRNGRAYAVRKVEVPRGSIVYGIKTTYDAYSPHQYRPFRTEDGTFVHTLQPAHLNLLLAYLVWKGFGTRMQPRLAANCNQSTRNRLYQDSERLRV